MNPFISLLSGLLAAFTPCVIVLFPLVLYRFFDKDKKHIKEYLIFLGGFIISYLVFAYAITGLFSSGLEEGIKLGFGLVFVVLGVLAIIGRLNPLTLPVMKNPFLLGSAFALLVSFSPCALPYLGIIVSLGSTGLVLINILFFGLGMIIPSILFAFIGNKILNLTKKGGKVFSKINKLMNVILVIAGLYLMLSIRMVHVYDVFVIDILLIGVFIIMLRAFFLVNRKKDILRTSTLLLIAALIILILTASFHCKQHIELEEEGSEYFCGQNGSILDCAICTRCLIMFSSAALLGGLGIFLKYKYNEFTDQHEEEKTRKKKHTHKVKKKDEDEYDGFY